jgi:PAS domain S-box-containing protein
MDIPELPGRKLAALFDQSPVAMVFMDVEVRAVRANAAFRQLTGLSDEVLIGYRPTEVPEADRILDTEFFEHTLKDQVIGKGTPVINMPVERTHAGEHLVFAWTAYRVTDNDQVVGAVGILVDITSQQAAATALRQANARLDLLQRAGNEIGTTLDLYRTAGELAALAVPQIADRVAVDILEPVLAGEDPGTGPGELRFRRLALVDAETARPNFAVGESFVLPSTSGPSEVFLRGGRLVARSQAEISQLGLPSNVVQPLLDQGVHTLISVSLRARGVTLGLAHFTRSQTPEPYEEAEVRLVTDLAARASLHIDNARLYTREHDSAITLQRSLLPREISTVAGLEIGFRYRPRRPPRSVATGSMSSSLTAAR